MRRKKVEMKKTYEVIKIREDYCVDCPKWEGGNIQYMGNCVNCRYCNAILLRVNKVFCEFTSSGDKPKKCH